MNNHQFKNINSSSHLRPDFSIRQSLLIAARLFIFPLLCATPAFSQQENWRYVTTITEGVKFYLGSDRQSTAGGNPLVWEKILRPDGASFVSFVEWDCRLKNRRTLQTTAYNADQTVAGTLKQPVWSPVIPDSSSARYFTV